MCKRIKKIIGIILAIMMSVSQMPMQTVKVDAGIGILSGTYVENVSITTGGEIKDYYFTPHYSGTYEIYTEGSYDTYGYLYSSSNNDGFYDSYQYNDDGGANYNFKFTSVSMERGRTYKIRVRMYSSSVTGMFSLYVGLVSKRNSSEVECSGMSGAVTWSIGQDGCLVLTGDGDYSNADWTNYSGKITSAVVNVSGLTSTYAMFLFCSNLEKIDLIHLNTENVRSMAAMFYGCLNLKSIDLTHIDTRNVTDMAGMFYLCNSLAELDVSSFDTENVVYMDYLFGYCSGLKELDLKNMDMRNVISADSMFSRCDNLEKIYSPQNCGISVSIPDGTWNDLRGNTYQYLPRNLSYSIELEKKIVITESMVTVTPTSYIYDGTAKEPYVTVKDGEKELTKDTDYTVTYTNNTGAGTATVTVTGKGNYTGKIKRTYDIEETTMEEVPTYRPQETTKQPTTMVEQGAVTQAPTTRVAKSAAISDTNSGGSVLNHPVAAKATAGKKVKLAKVKIKSITYKKKRMIVQINPVSNATGYEIRWATNKKLKRYQYLNTRNKKTNLNSFRKVKKGKKFYFKVRAYSISDAGKTYGAWSKVKKVKIK